jgi:hypothetical protein
MMRSITILPYVIWDKGLPVLWGTKKLEINSEPKIGYIPLLPISNEENS